ncbi:uncharacterized protein LOC131677591 [Topomyia yanbarensis]|uniref:uncharacterized protein LOC131677591 n=1 Tax=Topomyia yanbarensis TaxID=2498891 RepID=UPI00273C0F74|nr:uncharacterized protein LOC131677591 [Topomyia yanbarensis]
MDYQRFESILAASPLPRPSSSLASRIHPAGSPGNTPQDSDDNENGQQQPFRRSHSMRSSFTSLRSLKTRLKHPAAAAKYGPLSSPGREHYQQPHQQHTLTTAAAAAAKANLKTKLLKLRETYAEFKRLQTSSSHSTKVHVELGGTGGSANFKIPHNIPPKAAAVLLEEPTRRRVQRSQSLRISSEAMCEPRYAATIGGQSVEAAPGKPGTGSGSSKLTVRKTSLQSGATTQLLARANDDAQNLAIARTATIRKSSVWANSSSSKISLPDLVSRSLSTVGLPASCNVICPTVTRRDENANPYPTESSHGSSAPDVATVESPISSPTPTTLTVPVVLTLEDERAPNLSRMTSASSPNLSSAQGKKMEFLLPHQQHPPGSQPAVAPTKRQISPKIIKKTRHLSTSSADDEIGANSPKTINHRGAVGSHTETNNNNHNFVNGGGGIDVLASTGKLPSDRSTFPNSHHPYWKHKITKKQNKMAQAQLDKLTQINIHLHALFAAVEHGHLEKARTILESTDVDVNSLNSDGLSPLDVAVLSNNRSMTKMLLQQGAIENAHTIQAANSNVGLHLNNLLCEAESTIHELGNFDSGQPGQGSGGIGGTSGKTTFSNIIGKC